MELALSNGRLVALLGPYPETQNDASILNNILQNNQLPFMQASDTLVADRDFRDARTSVEASGIQFLYSAEQGPRAAPQSTEQASESRRVTKVRFVIEQFFCRLKATFRYFVIPVRYVSLTHNFQPLEIACVLLNKFAPTNNANQENPAVAQRLLDCMKMKNEMDKLVTEILIPLNLTRRNALGYTPTPVTDIATTFPHLTKDDLCLIACGSY